MKNVNMSSVHPQGTFGDIICWAFLTLHLSFGDIKKHILMTKILFYQSSPHIVGNRMRFLWNENNTEILHSLAYV